MPARARFLVGVGFRLGDRRDQLGKSLAANRNGRDHGHAERLRQRRRIEHQSVAFGQVDHIERDHRRPTQFEHFLREHQMLFEIGRVEHEDNHLGHRLAGKFAMDDFACHLLVGARGIETVGTGQIDQLDRFAARQRQPPRLPLHRDARIIGDLLACAG